MRYPVYFGCFGRTGRECIHLSLFDEHTGTLTQTAVIPTMLNPSYVQLDGEKRFLLSVMQDETRKGFVRVYRLNPDGAQPVCDAPTGGNGPCYVAVSPSNRYVSACNYPSGSFRIWALSPMGELLPVGRTHIHQGTGSNPQRQEGPHAHSTVWSPWQQDVVYVCDLGLDKIFRYRVGPDGVRKVGQTQAAPGSGPRHLIFSKATRRAYVTGEMGSCVTVFSVRENGALSTLERVSMLPDGYDGSNLAADIHLTRDGRYLYASNRGHDSIVCYPVNEYGLLGRPVWTDCRGRTPRGFRLSPDERWLLCANQDSGTVAVFPRDKVTGELRTPTVYDGYGTPCVVCF